MNQGWLPITTAVVIRHSAFRNDGEGASLTITTTATTLRRCAIFQNGSGRGLVSEKIAANSSHTLVVDAAAYTWDPTDELVTFGGDTFRVIGRPNNVYNLGRQMVVGLDLIE